MKPIIFFISVFFIIACIHDPGHYCIDFYNNSNHTISITYSISFPDTSLSKRMNLCNRIEPFSQCEGCNATVFEMDFDYNKHGILQFFISDEDTIAKYGVEDYTKNYRILKRFEYTLKDLDSMNWKIIYE